MADNGGTPLRSATITELATARAMLRPLGFTRERLAKPNIGVAHMWSETGPCNFSHRQVAAWVKDGVEAPAKETPGQQVILPVDRPLKQTGGIEIMYGNLAPEGCVIKLAGHDRTSHSGPAKVFENEEDCFQAVKDGQIQRGDVIVIRNEGPVGGPGMREMLHVTAAIVGAGLSEHVALITLEVPEAELEARRAEHVPAQSAMAWGVFGKYAETVRSASLGAVTTTAPSPGVSPQPATAAAEVSS